MPAALRSALGSVWLRVAVTAALLALVAAKVDWGTFVDTIADASPGWIALALLAGIAALVIGALRWWWLLREAGVGLTGGELGRVYAVGTFSSAFLLIGGDVARALLVTRERGLLLRVGLTVVADRAAAFAGMLVVAWGATTVGGTTLPDGALAMLALVTALTVAGSVAALGFAARGRFPAGRVGDALRALASTLRELAAVYGRRPLTGAVVASSSIAFQLLAAGQLCLLGEAFGVDLPLSVAAVSLTLVTVATLLPVSIAGFGLREGSYVVLLAPFGIDAADAVAISLTATVLLLIASLPGALLLARHGTKPVLG